MEVTNRQAERERWGRIHIAGDRNPPIYLPDRRVRRSVGTATSIRKSGKEAVTYE